MRRHQHPTVASGLFPLVKVLWTDRDPLQEGESTAGVLAKADRRLLSRCCPRFPRITQPPSKPSASSSFTPSKLYVLFHCIHKSTPCPSKGSFSCIFLYFREKAAGILWLHDRSNLTDFKFWSGSDSSTPSMWCNRPTNPAASRVET